MMARKGLYKYRWHKDRNLATDIAVMSLAVFFAGLTIFGAIKLTGSEWLLGEDTLREDTLRGAAEEKTENDPTEEVAPIPAVMKEPIAVSELPATIKVTSGDGYGYIGQKDVPLFSFELTAPVKARLKQIRLSVDGYSGSGDLSSLQLYYENKLAGQAPVTGAEALFDRIDITLEPGRTASFTVKGNIGEQAKSGDRVNVGIFRADDILLADGSAIMIRVDADYPLWGGLTSIIGSKVKK